MTGAERFCPECGATVEVDPEERALPEYVGRTRRRLESLCDDCYLAEFDLVDAPDRLQVQVCASCGAIKRGDRWVDVDARDYTDVAIEAVSEELSVHVDAEKVNWSIEPEQVDPTTIRVHATFTGEVRQTPVEESVTVAVALSRGTCTRCGRIAGDYYASTLQVRAEDREPTTTETGRAEEIATAVIKEMTETGDRDAFVTEIADTDDGLNIKVSTTNIGKKIADRLIAEFGGTYDSSETLVTEDEDGNEVYRVTYAVRLPPFQPGDVIDPGDDEGPVLVESVQGALKGRRLSTGHRFESSLDDLESATRLGTSDDATETTLVAIEDEHAVQVLDPETAEATTIARPADLDPDAETVRVLKHRNGLHVMPAE